MLLSTKAGLSRTEVDSLRMRVPENLRFGGSEFLVAKGKVARVDGLSVDHILALCC